LLALHRKPDTSRRATRPESGHPLPVFVASGGDPHEARACGPSATSARVLLRHDVGEMDSYERLSGLDECFLGFETRNAPMHVAVTGIFERGDPRRRFETIHATTDELKRGGEAAGGSVIAEAANWAGGAVVESAARLIGSARIYNLIVTNVPGPSVPLYLAGARMREAYPHLPLFEQQGIGIALLSYVGRLAVCIAADFDLGGLLRDIVERMEAALVEVVALVGLTTETDEAARRARLAGSGARPLRAAHPRSR
jgi:hypothetical protein